MNFRQVSGFAEEELLRFEGLEVPEGADVVRPKLVHEEGDGRVEMLGLFGPNADRSLARKIFLNINPQFGVVTMALKVELAEHERAFSLLGVYDEKGAPMELKEVTPGPLNAKEEGYMPVLVRFKPRAEVKKVSLVCAIPKSRRVEFLAKPVQR
jgi:hypothetical protein